MSRRVPLIPGTQNGQFHVTEKTGYYGHVRDMARPGSLQMNYQHVTGGIVNQVISRPALEQGESVAFMCAHHDKVYAIGLDKPDNLLLR